MRWLLAGASGFLGNALRDRLAGEGHEVVRLVRREPATSTEFRWDPYAGEVDPTAFEGVDAVVNLAGVNLYTRPWTTSRREVIVASRAATTGTLARALAERAATHDERPVFLAQSATGYYGVVSGDRPLYRGLPRRPGLRRPGLRPVGGTRPDRRGCRRSGRCPSDRPGPRPQRQLVPADADGLVLRSGCQARQRSPMDAHGHPRGLSQGGHLGGRRFGSDRTLQPDDPRTDHECRVHRRVGPGATSAPISGRSPGRAADRPRRACGHLPRRHLCGAAPD